MLASRGRSSVPAKLFSPRSGDEPTGDVEEAQLVSKMRANLAGMPADEATTFRHEVSHSQRPQAGTEIARPSRLV
jgi:hypothetical protein